MTTLRELAADLPEGLTRDEELDWLTEANQTVEATVGLTPTPEQMKRISSDAWHALKDDPFLVNDLVRQAHRAFKERYGS